MRSIHALALIFALAWAGTPQAQTIWRCGPDGKAYSDSPCADGQPVLVSDVRSASDLAAARATAANDRALAERLTKDRMTREASLGSGLAGIRSTAPLTSAAAQKTPIKRLKSPPKPFTVKLAKSSSA